MEEGQQKIYEVAIEHYGQERQVIKTIEECGELIQILAQSLNSDFTYSSAAVIEKLVDVQIMLHQMSLLCGKEMFDSWVVSKTRRLSVKIACELGPENISQSSMKDEECHF